MDNFDKEVIRRVIHQFYAEKKLPTCKMIRKQLEKQDIFVSSAWLYKNLPNLGFQLKITAETRKFFVERVDIQASRASYFRNVRHYRDAGYQIVYLDETWINQNHYASFPWRPDNKFDNILELMKNKLVKFPKIPSRKGNRLIILHAGSEEEGFSENCELIFKGHYVDGDYHKEMNAQVFLNWFENQLMPALKSPSVIVLDNASYHNTRAEESKFPTSANKKGEIQDWLRKENVNFWHLMTKPELLQLVKEHKRPLRYKTDDISEINGHIVLRSPVRHCELNPIELISQCAMRAHKPLTETSATTHGDLTVRAHSECINEIRF